MERKLNRKKLMENDELETSFGKSSQLKAQLSYDTSYFRWSDLTLEITIRICLYSREWLWIFHLDKIKKKLFSWHSPHNRWWILMDVKSKTMRRSAKVHKNLRAKKEEFLDDLEKLFEKVPTFFWKRKKQNKNFHALNDISFPSYITYYRTRIADAIQVGTQ